jgi:hypothetical protein
VDVILASGQVYAQQQQQALTSCNAGAAITVPAAGTGAKNDKGDKDKTGEILATPEWDKFETKNGVANNSSNNNSNSNKNINSNSKNATASVDVVVASSNAVVKPAKWLTGAVTNIFMGILPNWEAYVTPASIAAAAAAAGNAASSAAGNATAANPNATATAAATGGSVESEIKDLYRPSAHQFYDNRAVDVTDNLSKFSNKLIISIDYEQDL